MDVVDELTMLVVVVAVVVVVVMVERVPRLVVDVVVTVCVEVVNVPAPDSTYDVPRQVRLTVGLSTGSTCVTVSVTELVAV